MRSINKNQLTAIVGFLAALHVLLALIGGIRSHSSVPYMDMWDSYLYFFIHASEGDLSMWWAQHNEHRLVLARALFYIDLAVFHGNGVFLIAVNYVLAASAFLVLYACLNEALENSEEKFPRNILGLVILALLFSWLQKENFTWAFQCQFFLAQLLPLSAFVLLHKAHTSENRSSRFFFLACIAGILALGSMANGVLALPLMCLLAMVLRMKWFRIVTLALLAGAANFAYFTDYHLINAHGSLRDAIAHQPFQLLQYFLLYLGGPCFALKGIHSRVIAMLAGAFLIGSAIFFSRKSIKNSAQSSLQLAMLTFLLYIGGTALGTAGGRLVFGIDQALSGRYSTPTLMAWSALLILYAPAIAEKLNRDTAKYAWPFILLLVLLLPRQRHGLDSYANELFERKVAALAAGLGVQDKAQMAAIFPVVDRPIARAKESMERGLTIFGDPVFRDPVKRIGTTEIITPSARCRGAVEALAHIEGEPRFMKIEGWVFMAESKSVPQAVRILDLDGKVVGYAYTGKPRKDLKEGIDPKAELSGFKGYIFSNADGKPVILKATNPDCELRANVAAAGG